jgi:hypothetical protein
VKTLLLLGNVNWIKAREASKMLERGEISNERQDGGVSRDFVDYQNSENIVQYQRQSRHTRARC